MTVLHFSTLFKVFGLACERQNEDSIGEHALRVSKVQNCGQIWRARAQTVTAVLQKTRSVCEPCEAPFKKLGLERGGQLLDAVLQLVQNSFVTQGQVL